MNKNTLKITQGALMTAIFGAFVLLNRQTAGFAEAFLVYFYPLPIAAYCAKYGTVGSIPAAIAMSLIAFLLGTPTAAFYAITSVLVGLVFGTCLYHRASAEKTLFWVMLSSVAVSLLDIVFAAFISGITLEEDALSMQKMMQEMLEKAMSSSGQSLDEASMKAMEQMLSIDFLKRILVISTALAGALQGFLIYELGLLILRRLKIKVQKPKSIYEFKPPVWTGWVALGLFVLYILSASVLAGNADLQSIAMTVGVLGYLYLLIFGAIGGTLLIHRLMPTHKFLPGILSFLGMMILPYLWIGIGFCYITGVGGLFDPASGLFVRN